ncbi:hypothetical protein D187_005149 [Cystobacter fuscus DSM 2262]|uniref:Uncharacterized protein n=1 Tax=Cystobacter fuscus (strain ATCC 25194 / DSM 2262 / NBRC 100088 / M29) TaxID=1242864 RepID=S9PLY3_CYSF2|nr:hypothetical protein D187_005149 [Cystobacter fuscus DSM 2262]
MLECTAEASGPRASAQEGGRRDTGFPRCVSHPEPGHDSRGGLSRPRSCSSAIRRYCGTISTLSVLHEGPRLGRLDVRSRYRIGWPAPCGTSYLPGLPCCSFSWRLSPWRRNASPSLATSTFRTAQGTKYARCTSRVRWSPFSGSSSPAPRQERKCWAGKVDSSPWCVSARECLSSRSKTSNQRIASSWW